jgi:hypothetical protein
LGRGRRLDSIERRLDHVEPLIRIEGLTFKHHQAVPQPTRELTVRDTPRVERIETVVQSDGIFANGELFVASDDYYTLAAAERGQPDFLPCWS